MNTGVFLSQPLGHYSKNPCCKDAFSNSVPGAVSRKPRIFGCVSSLKCPTLTFVMVSHVTPNVLGFYYAYVRCDVKDSDLYQGTFSSRETQSLKLTLSCFRVERFVPPLSLPHPHPQKKACAGRVWASGYKLHTCTVAGRIPN